jgi:hypothetical protein
MAPSTLLCPRCLGPVPNPPAGESKPRGAGPAWATPPLRVVPLENQTRRDGRAAAGLLFAIALVLAAGAFLTLRDRGASPVGLTLAVACGVVLVTAVMQIRHPESRKVEAATVGIFAVAGTLFKIGVVVIGVLLLLLGACAVLVGGGSLFGSRH